MRLGRLPPTGSGFTPTIQERAWSSPIWYTPSAEARQTASKGLTVTDLKQRGAVALSDAQLEQLIVGKTVRVRNTVTGQRFEILYGTTGQRLVTAVDGKAPELQHLGELMHGGRSHYEIRNGRLVTDIAGTPFEVTVYELGDRYIAARANEFGYANYEVEPADQ